MDTKPKRRWYQFSLRTFFVLVTLVCVGFGYWIHWSREWIRQRHEMFQNGLVRDISRPGSRPFAPGGLWLFGEEGISALVILRYDGSDDKLERRVIELFPEIKNERH